jgi:hypothetical protein
MYATFGEVPDFYFSCWPDNFMVSRVFWYDCEQECDEGETHEEKLWARRQLELVRGADKFRLRLGTLSRNSRPRSANQKEVDVLLAVELLSNAYIGNMQEAILVTGDLDFRPAIEEVARRGTVVHLYYDSSGVSKELLDAVDIRCDMGVDDYVRCVDWNFRSTRPLPRVANLKENNVDFLNGNTLAEGSLKGERVVLKQKVNDINTWVLLMPARNTSPDVLFTGYVFQRNQNEYVLQSYIPRVFSGKLEWANILNEELKGN